MDIEGVPSVGRRWIVDPNNETLEIYVPNDEDNPRLYLVKQGIVNSLIDKNVSFDLKKIFQ